MAVTPAAEASAAPAQHGTPAGHGRIHGASGSGRGSGTPAVTPAGRPETTHAEAGTLTGTPAGPGTILAAPGTPPAPPAGLEMTHVAAGIRTGTPAGPGMTCDGPGATRAIAAVNAARTSGGGGTILGMPGLTQTGRLAVEIARNALAAAALTRYPLLVPWEHG